MSPTSYQTAPPRDLMIATAPHSVKLARRTFCRTRARFAREKRLSTRCSSPALPDSVHNHVNSQSQYQTREKFGKKLLRNFVQKLHAPKGAEQHSSDVEQKDRPCLENSFALNHEVNRHARPVHDESDRSGGGDHRFF